MKCPICESRHLKEDYLHFKHEKIDYILVKCFECECIFYLNDVDFDFKNNFEHNRNLRLYLEKTADAESLITVVHNLFYQLPDSLNKGIDIGCGVGLIMDFAEKEFGKDIYGFEPSLHYSNEAKDLLNLNIVQDFFSATLVNEKVDFVFCFQVLQMIREPQKLLLDIKEILNSNGILLLSTPDNQVILPENKLAENFPILSPGVHKIIFSEKSLKIILKNCGFPFTQIFKSHNQYYILASFTEVGPIDILWPDRNVVLKYYKNKLESLSERSSYFKGVWYRYYRNLIDHGEYDEALELLKQTKWFEIWTEKDINQISHIDKLFELNSFADAIIYYYTGILFLNNLHKPIYAEKFFQLSFLLCKKLLALQPGMCAIEEDIIWLAKLHVIISKIYNGKVEEGKTEIIYFLAFNNLNEEILPKIPLDLIKRAESIRKNIS